jgi:hypothetical protein
MLESAITSSFLPSLCAMLQRQRGLIAAANAVRDLASGGGSAPQPSAQAAWNVPTATDAQPVATWVLPGPQRSIVASQLGIDVDPSLPTATAWYTRRSAMLDSNGPPPPPQPLFYSTGARRQSITAEAGGPVAASPMHPPPGSGPSLTTGGRFFSFDSSPQRPGITTAREVPVPLRLQYQQQQHAAAAAGVTGADLSATMPSRGVPASPTTRAWAAATIASGNAIAAATAFRHSRPASPPSKPVARPPGSSLTPRGNNLLPPGAAANVASALGNSAAAWAVALAPQRPGVKPPGSSLGASRRTGPRKSDATVDFSVTAGSEMSGMRTRTGSANRTWRGNAAAGLLASDLQAAQSLELAIAYLPPVLPPSVRAALHRGTSALLARQLRDIVTRSIARTVAFFLRYAPRRQRLVLDALEEDYAAREKVAADAHTAAVRSQRAEVDVIAPSAAARGGAQVVSAAATKPAAHGLSAAAVAAQVWRRGVEGPERGKMKVLPLVMLVLRFILCSENGVFGAHTGAGAPSARSVQPRGHCWRRRGAEAPSKLEPRRRQFCETDEGRGPGCWSHSWLSSHFCRTVSFRDP